MQVRRAVRTGAVVVTVRGECDLLTADPLRTQLAAQVRAGRDHVVVDLTELAFIDSTGLSVLIGAHDLVAAGGGHLDLVVGSGRVLQVLRISALTQVFTIHTTVEDALAACWHADPDGHQELASPVEDACPA